MSDTHETQGIIERLKITWNRETSREHFHAAKEAAIIGIENLETQRDEARATIADAIDLLDGNIHHSDINQDDELLRKMVMHLEAMFDEVKLRRERDEAKAEVERLRKLIPAYKQMDWPDSAIQGLPDTPPEIFEAHGLEWYRHTPGDKMPCDGSEWVQAFLRDGEIACLKDEVEASFLEWGKISDCEECEIIGWRPADAPDKLPRK